LAQVGGGIGWQEGSAKDGLRHGIVSFESIEHSLQLLQLLLRVYLAQFLIAEDALV